MMCESDAHCKNAVILERSLMPTYPHPPAGDNPFPPSKGWQGQPWAETIDYYIKAHGPGSDALMGFDDADRLCVVQHGERGFCVRIPKTLVEWSEREMKVAGVEPEQAYRDQMRFRRGEGGSLLRSTHKVERDDVVRKLAEFTGINPEAFKNTLHGRIQDFDFGQDFPMKIGKFESGSFPFAYVTLDVSTWNVHHGTIDPSGEGDAYVTTKLSSGNKRRSRGGTVHAYASRKVDDRMEMDREHIARRAEIMAEKAEDEDNTPDGP
jgi:hypothetical protein